MSKPFLHPQFKPSERSASLVFAGGRLDRLSELRSETSVEDALAEPASKVMGFARGRVLIDVSSTQPRGLFSIDELQDFSPQLEKAILLGNDNGVEHLAVPLSLNPDEEDFASPEGYAVIDYRSLAVQGLLSPEQLGMVAYGGALLAWHATHRFCARCGAATALAEGGAKRVCTSCETQHFPRTDPVVIMLTVKDDKCLLGRSPHFPPGMYSALAGFVEAGETIEMAVRRETFEESGIRVGAVRYHATQPWPFPHTLMIGCYSEALDDDIELDELELEDCRWFNRDEVLTILAGAGETHPDGTPKLFMPPPMAIAHALIRDWAEGKA